MECTTTNSRQSNERLKNGPSLILLIAVFIEIQYISANVSLPVCLSLFLQWPVTHTHAFVHEAHLVAISNTHKHAHRLTEIHTLKTHTNTEGSFFSEWSMFSVQSSLFDTEPFCTCSRACTEYVEGEWEMLTPQTHTHTHTHSKIHPLIVIGLDGLGVKAVVQ